MVEERIEVSESASRKLLERFLAGMFRAIVSLGVYFLFVSLIMLWAGDIMGVGSTFFLLISVSCVLVCLDFFLTRQQLHEIPPSTQDDAIEKIYAEFKLILTFILLINVTFVFLYLLPLFILEFDVINFTQPFSAVINWFYLSEGIFLCVLSYFFNSKKRKIISQVKLQKILHEFFEPTETQRTEITNQLKIHGIFPNGEIVMVFENVGYSDPAYVRKRFRKWPWREKGKIILTEKQLIFLGKKEKFVIPLSEIHSIQPFPARGGIRTFKVCEIKYDSPKVSIIFIGNVSFWVSDPPTTLELKSMRLMETLQKWYNTWNYE